ncbi:alpha/beta hydrolase [Microbulbifer sp. TRSA001]|uniref:alpha/beta hydrolase n=1 Tax=Microbulbifer sp. TRSA001 TaxID=3243381 RepID=UPI004039BC0A
MNKLYACLFFILCSALGLSSSVNADTIPFQIPRSHSLELADPASKRIYPLFIKLPKSYMNAPHRRYPLVLITDGDSAFQTISGATQVPMEFGKLQEVILVGLSYSKGSSDQVSRIRDFTPTTDNNWKYLTGKATEHATFIHDVILPHLSNSYRLTGSGHTFIGHSLGGLLGTYMLLTRPTGFNNYILGSPSIWYDSESILSIKAAPSPIPRKVFVGVGSLETPVKSQTRNDMVGGAKKLHRKLIEEKGVEIESKLLIIPGANHGTSFPTTAIQGLDWLYKTNLQQGSSKPQ